MKRTVQTQQNASTPKRFTQRRLFVTAVAVLLAGAMFMLGRVSLFIPSKAQKSMVSLEAEIRGQQATVDRLLQRNRSDVNALAVQLAELQAASTRLDALGERLAHMAQLSPEEFDFDEPVPLGGAGELSSDAAVSVPELRTSVAALSERLRLQSSRLDALKYLMLNRQLESEFTPAGWPVRKGWISSRYGQRTDPFTGEQAHHRGLDFAGVRGSDVLSVAGGVVIWAGQRAAYGETVEIDHGNGFRTRYAHCDSLQVQAGDRVVAGQVIALMGSTGRASAPHVHFEVLQDGNPVNPSRYVRQLR